MNTRPLGHSGLQVSPLCLGGNVFGWTIDEPTSFTILDGFVDAGLNFVDTADVYSRWAPGHAGGESETIIGNWIARTGKRSKLVLATKLGKDMGDGKTGLKRQYMMQAVEASLRRLQTDYIDLYQSHADDPDTPQEETLEGYAQLVKQGKVRAIGASNFTAGRLDEALGISESRRLARYECLQPHYNLIERADYETSLEPLCVAKGIGVIPYFALAAGFLTGKYREEADLAKSARAGMVKKYLNDRGFRILGALDAIAARHNATAGQVAIAWLAARPSVTAPIASATSVTQLTGLIAALRLELNASDMASLNQASA